ncbi:hypothetical protein A5865_002677, partial [Enterococcus sp. 12E11_DIV0728]
GFNKNDYLLRPKMCIRDRF